MDDLVKTVQGFNPDLQAWVVISRASTNPSVSEVAEARSLLADFEHVQLSSVVIRDRIAYRKAARAGLSVEELKPADPNSSVATSRSDCQTRWPVADHGISRSNAL
jgi:chromosome partitioning protein